MFRLPLTLLIVATAATALFLFRPHSGEREAYERLLASSRPTKVMAEAQQEREEISKEVWWEKEGTPYHFHLESEKSQLFVFEEKKEFEVIEEMENVLCTFQQELFNKGDELWQKVGYFEAERAAYNYTTGILHADKVKLWTFELEGHDLPTLFEKGEALLQGKAQCIDLALQNGALSMNARFLRGQMKQENGDLRRFSADRVNYDGKFLRQEGHVVLKDASKELYADEGLMVFEHEREPSHIQFSGNVELIKEGTQFALANRVDYSPQTEETVLTGEPVLFYDVGKEMQLAAKKVIAHRNPESGEDVIQGVGDVRFLFGQEEFEKIKHQFRHEANLASQES